MEKVDKLIEDLADHISGILNDGNDAEHEIEEKTKALADLISARAICSSERRIKVTNADCDNLIKKNAQKGNMGIHI